MGEVSSDASEMKQQGQAVRPWCDEQSLSLHGCNLTPAFSREGGRRHASGSSAVSQRELRARLSSSAVLQRWVPAAPGLTCAIARVQAPLGHLQHPVRLQAAAPPHAALWRGWGPPVQPRRTSRGQDRALCTQPQRAPQALRSQESGLPVPPAKLFSLTWKMVKVKQPSKNVVAGNVACYSRPGLLKHPLRFPEVLASPRPQCRHITGVLLPLMLQNLPKFSWVPKGQWDCRELHPLLGLAVSGGQ